MPSAASRSHVATRTAVFNESVIREMTRLAQVHGAVNLAQGYPDFAAPDFIKQAAVDAVRADINQYAITWGSRRLRDAIAAKSKRWHGLELDPDREITVTCGATEAMMCVLVVVKRGGREEWLGYGERARPAHPERVYISIRKGLKPDDALGRHWCFKARWRTQVYAFWDAGLAAGGSDEGPPGLRDYHAAYYAAFLRDPDGNRIEAVCHHPV